VDEDPTAEDETLKPIDRIPSQERRPRRNALVLVRIAYAEDYHQQYLAKNLTDIAG
jgi:peptide methionine sulfoxide reductase MsrA